MKIKDLNHTQLIQLRKEISLGSLFLDDYENSLGIDPKEALYFFDSFIEYVSDQAQEDPEFLGDPNNYQDVLFYYDNEDYLVDYFDYIEW